MTKHAFHASPLALALVSIGFACGAHAQTTTATNAAATQHAARTTLSSDDQRFVQKAAEGGMAEVEAGKLALKKGQDAQVKQFAQRMIDDHTKANDRLKQIASAKGVDVPVHLDKKGEQEIDKLSKLSGGDFDSAYIKSQVSDHQSVIKDFKKEAKSAKDSDLRQFANDTLPTLDEHLRLAQSAEQDVASKSASAGSGHTKTASASPGLKAAQDATGSTRSHAEKQDRMPVPKTGM